MSTIESQVIGTLINDEGFARRVLPHLYPEYFNNQHERWVVNQIAEHFNRYGRPPNRRVLATNLQADRNVNETAYGEVVELLENGLTPIADSHHEWLVDRTEKFCQERALYNALNESIVIADGEDDRKRDWGAIPMILTDALGISFDESVGHDYLHDHSKRWDWYETEEARIPFRLDMLNKVTRGGLPSKTFNCILAGTGVGKSLAMCDFASYNLLDGRNVLYVTLELSEEMVAERIDANLMGVNINDIRGLGRSGYIARMQDIATKSSGRIVVKEYPTAGAHVGHFRNLMNDLWVKQRFKPDIVYVDYLNICASHRYRNDGAVGSYFYVKSVAEELRGLAVEKDFVLVTATQTNRDGATSTDPDMKDTSESFGLPMTCDFLVALVSTEEMQDNNQAMFKVLKNRFNRRNYYRRFLVGMNTDQMRLTDLDPDDALVVNNGEEKDRDVQQQQKSGRSFDDFD